MVYTKIQKLVPYMAMCTPSSGWSEKMKFSKLVEVYMDDEYCVDLKRDGHFTARGLEVF